MHRSVLLKEVVDWLVVRQGGVYVDGTLGGAGHALSILDRAGPEAVLIGIDRDPEALERARATLEAKSSQCRFWKGNYADMDRIAHKAGFGAVDGILLDLGVSSEQLESTERGFSFLNDGPLDMRMDPSCGRSAADWIASLTEEELARTLREFGEEPRARAMARRLAARRVRSPIRTTGDLAGLIASCYADRHGRTHPATRAFQALRILVNDELGCLSRGLESGLRLLAPGGRMAVISFHSLEDRIVKRCFALHEGRWIAKASGGEEWEGEEPLVARLTRRPAVPSPEEIERNPRARSAKLRVVQRVGPRADGGIPSRPGEKPLRAGMGRRHECRTGSNVKNGGGA